MNTANHATPAQVILLPVKDQRSLVGAIEQAYKAGTNMRGMLPQAVQSIVNTVPDTTAKNRIGSTMKSILLDSLEVGLDKYGKDEEIGPGWNLEEYEDSNGKTQRRPMVKAAQCYINSAGHVVARGSLDLYVRNVAARITQYMKESGCSLKEAKEEWLANPEYQALPAASKAKAEPAPLPDIPGTPMAKTSQALWEGLKTHLLLTFCVDEDGKWLSKAKIEARVKAFYRHESAIRKAA